MKKPDPIKQAAIMAMLDEAKQESKSKPEQNVSTPASNGNSTTNTPSFLKWVLAAFYLFPFIHASLYQNRWTYWLILSVIIVLLYIGYLWLVIRSSKGK